MAEVKISAEYVKQYNHAGLMVRIDEQHWLKCGVEYVGEEQKASAVVMRVYSDWSLAPLPPRTAALWLRVVREGTTFTIFYAQNGVEYQMLREAYLPAAASVEVGPMCASSTETDTMPSVDTVGEFVFYAQNEMLLTLRASVHLEFANGINIRHGVFFFRRKQSVPVPIKGSSAESRQN